MFSNLSLNNNDRSGKYNDVDTTLQSVERKFQENRFIGIDLLKFQVSSYSALDKIDVGSLRGDDESFPENHEGRLRPELGGLIDVRESEEVSTVFQECDSGSNIRHWIDL